MVTSNSINLASKGGRTVFSFDSPEFQATKFGAFWMTDDPHGPLAVMLELPPNYKGQAHTHKSDYMAVVIEGSLKTSGRWYRPGEIRFQDANTVYGPSLAGPEGARVLVLYADRNGLPDQFVKESDRVEMAEMMERLGRFARQEIPFSAVVTPEDDDVLVNP
jgi:hypothetical protein